MTPFNLSHMAINAASINVDCNVRIQRCLSVSTRTILRASVRNVNRVREKKKLIKKCCGGSE